MSVQAVLFDLDETLMPEDAPLDEALRATARLAQERHDGLQPERLVRAVRATAARLWRESPHYERCVALGLASWEGLHDPGVFESPVPALKALRAWLERSRHREEVWRRALDLLGVGDGALARELAARFHEERAERFQPFPDAVPTLEALRRRGYRLGLVTNGPSGLQRAKLERSGLAPFFEAVAISGELGVGKPEAAIFERALEALGVPPERAVMVGNSLERDVRGAQDAGLKAVWVRRESLEDEFLASAPLPLPASDVRPDAVIRELRELPAALAQL